MTTTTTVTHGRDAGSRRDPGTVLVAVDGHHDGWDALDWSVAEAGARGASLLVVHVAGLSWALDPFGGSTGLHLAVGGAGQRVLDAARERAQALAPSLPISTRLLTGRPAAAIARAGRHAELLVLGRPDPAVPHRPGGSVGTRVARRARGSVVVVGLSDEGTRGPSAGRVVVEYDGHRAARPALAFAFHAAHSRGLDLTVLRPSDRLTRDDALAAWRDAHPRVHVREQVVTGPRDAALVAESAAAALLVLGSPAHRRWPFSRDRRADVAAVADAAHSPVALVPDD